MSATASSALIQIRTGRVPGYGSERAPALLGSSILARLPLAMFSIALLVHAQQLTDLSPSQAWSAAPTRSPGLCLPRSLADWSIDRGRHAC